MRVSPRATSRPSPTATGSPPSVNQITETDIDGGGATGVGTAEAELDIDRCCRWHPRRTSRSTRAAPSDSLYTVFSKIINDDSAKIISASWTNGCEAYVGQSVQQFREHALPGGSRGGAVNFRRLGRPRQRRAATSTARLRQTTGTNPVAQAVDASTGTLYIANKTQQYRERGQRGQHEQPVELQHEGLGVPPARARARPPWLWTPRPARLRGEHQQHAYRRPDQPRATRPPRPGAARPPRSSRMVTSSSPAACRQRIHALRGEQQRHGRDYNALDDAFITSVTLPPSSVPTALAVDSTNGFVYVADGTNNRLEYFDASTRNATTFTTPCSTAPSIEAVGHDPVAADCVGRSRQPVRGQRRAPGAVSRSSA